jgi:serine/threonine protein phosphatase 1
MKTYVLGDVHGAYKALMQVIERSGINKDEDKLIFLGDVADGWDHTPKCVEELLTFKNIIRIAGNHDLWAYAWMETQAKPPGWLQNGGRTTLDAYHLAGEKTILRHRDLYFRRMVPYEIIGNNIFTHGGFLLDHHFDHNSDIDFAWDRSLFKIAQKLYAYGEERQLSDFDEIYIGHTTTERYSAIPLKMCNVWALDQGAGWGGKLSIMDVETKQFWQSDTVSDLYPGELSRRTR